MPAAGATLTPHRLPRFRVQKTLGEVGDREKDQDQFRRKHGMYSSREEGTRILRKACGLGRWGLPLRRLASLSVSPEQGSDGGDQDVASFGEQKPQLLK